MAPTSRNQVSSELIAELAVSAVRHAVLRELGFLFRPQLVSDFGIDAHVELTDLGEVTGQLIALQIKGGRSAFAAPTEDGWNYRVKARHAHYWLNHSLPVILVLADVDAGQCYWQVINSATLKSAGNNFKVHVPAKQMVGSAGVAWADLVERSTTEAAVMFEANLRRVPPHARTHLTSLHQAKAAVAEALAADLASGRSNPRAAVQELVTARAEWLDRHGPLTWRAIATYSRDHQLHREASKAYEKFAHHPDGNRASGLAEAAMHLAGVNDAQAQKLLGWAIDTDPHDSHVLAAEAALGHRVDEIRLLLSQRSDPAALSFLANDAALGNAESEAIWRFRELTERIPDNDAIRLILAQLLLHRSTTPEADSNDISSALELARSTLNEQRYWTENTVPALTVYARALLLQSRLDELLTATAAPPIGNANPHEAGDTEIAMFAIEAARRKHRTDLLRPIAQSISDPVDRELALEDIRLIDAGVPEEHVSHMQHMLERALLMGNPQRAYEAALRLAMAGVDASAQLAQTEVGATHVDVLPLVAAARHDPQTNLSKLRRAAKTSIVAAEILIETLARLERTAQAIEACELAFEVFALPSFLISKVQLLLHADQRGAAVSTLEDLLSRSALTGEPLLHAHGMLGEHYEGIRDWKTAAEHYRQLLQIAPGHTEQATWSLVRCLLMLGQPAVARRILESTRIEPVTDAQIRIWLNAINTTGWTESTASFAVTLSLRPNLDPSTAAALLGQIITDTKATARSDSEEDHDQRPLVSASVHEQAFAALATLMSTHGDEFPIRSVAIDGDTFLDELRAVLAQHDPTALMKLDRQVFLGELPVGTLSDVRERPYGFVLASRLIRTVSYPDAERHAIETDAARAAFDRRVIVDLSAVETAHHLGLWSECEGQFSTLIVTTAQRIDAARSVMAARSATGGGGTFGLTSDGHPIATERDPATQLATLQRCEEVETATRNLLTVDVGVKLEFAGPLEVLGMHTWISVIEAAGRESAALWSDDLAQRKAAAALGIPTFSSINIIEALRSDSLPENASAAAVDAFVDDQHAFVLHLLERCVVDQPITVDDIRGSIAGHPGELSPASILVARPTWWQHNESLSDWMLVLDSVREHSPEHLRAWQAHAMHGIADAANPEFAPHLIAALAAIGVGEAPTVDDAVQGFRQADRICVYRDLPPASVHVAWAVARLNLTELEMGAFAQAVIDALSTERT